ncbi:exonuclease V isoform X2 [Procambarus clarkii]|uniref:exonuclease V isoform X2 n=2 Tax=Procambarus clarkii TaxID=6728 RepID=UPI00374424D8
MASSDADWGDITDDDILAVNLEQAFEQAAMDAPTQTAKKRHNSGSSSRVETKDKPLPPIESLRGGYLWVSDFSKQMWCEQQMEYCLTMPPDIIIPEPKQVTKGSELHLARELEVQDYVNVKVTSSEDIFAIKVINLLIVLKSILTMSSITHREVPIFGVVDGIFILGKIDEVRVDRETFNLDIVDLKTRKIQKPPGKAQKVTHNAQVMLYKRLFDDLVRGLIPRHSLTVTLQLDLDRTLGESVTENICSSLTSLLNIEDKNTPWTLCRLLDELKKAAESLPFISQLFIDYVWQEDQQTFLIEEVKYDDIWLKNTMTKCLTYWKGERECQGVDIEDAWKCHSCDFQEGCKWIAQKTKELQLARETKQLRK